QYGKGQASRRRGFFLADFNRVRRANRVVVPRDGNAVYMEIAAAQEVLHARAAIAASRCGSSVVLSCGAGSFLAAMEAIDSSLGPGAMPHSKRPSFACPLFPSRAK